MLLLLMQVQADTGTPRDVSVWVNDTNQALAEQRAIVALAAAGWLHVRTIEVTSTAAEDYFRPCPSQQAFARAHSEGIAWRFDDDAGAG